VYLPACLPACPPARLPACLPACQGQQGIARSARKRDQQREKQQALRRRNPMLSQVLHSLHT
jgi:hypothetical protein